MAERQEAVQLQTLCLDILATIARLNNLDISLWQKLTSFQPKTASDADTLCVKIRAFGSYLHEIKSSLAVQQVLPVAVRSLTTILQYFTLPFLPSSTNPSVLPPNPEKVREALLAASAALLEKCQCVDHIAFSSFLSSFLKLFDLDQPPLLDTKVPQTAVVRDVRQQSGSVSCLSEELHESLGCCIRWLFCKLEADAAPAVRLERISQMFGQSEQLPTLGYLVYRTLELSATLKSKSVVLGYLQAMHAIVDALTDSPILPSFLPGLISTFSRILSGDFKRGAAVFEAAVDLLSSVIVVSMNDTRNPTVSSAPKNKFGISNADAIAFLRNLKQPDYSETEQPDEAPYPSASWFLKASERIVPVLQRLFRIANRGSSLDEFDSPPISAAAIAFESPRVRIAVARAAHILCCRCSNTLRALVPLLLDVLVTFRQDPFPQVAEAAQAAIIDLGSADFQGFIFPDVVQQNLERLIASIPRVIRMTDESAKELRLRALLGYLLLQRATLASGLLPRLSQALMDCLEINLRNPWKSPSTSARILDDLSTSEQSTARPTGDAASTSSFRSRLQFLHFQEASILDLLIQIIHTLATYGDGLHLIDHFLSVFRGDNSSLDVDVSAFHSPPQAILVLNEIIVGTMSSQSARQKDDALSVFDAADYLLVHYLSSEALEDFSTEGSLVSAQTATHRLVLMALVLDGVGTCAAAMGPAIRWKLMDMLYPLLERLGDEADMVSHAAWSSLLRTAVAVGSDSVLHLVQDNSDYIIDSIVQNLRYLKKYGSSVRVLQGILRHAGEFVVPILGDILDEVFRCLDERDRTFTSAFLRVVAEATKLIKAKVLRRVEPAPPPEDQAQSFHDTDVETNRLVIENDKLDLGRFFAAKLQDRAQHQQQIRALRMEQASTTAEDFFKKYHEDKERNSAEDMHPSQEEPDDNVPDHAVDDDPTARRPGEAQIKYEIRVSMARELKIMERILEKCQHFTAVAGVDSRLLVLEMISNAVVVLDCDQNSLLPLVHKVWEPLTHRFVDLDPRVAAAALALMQMLAEKCGEFVSKRFCDDLWPTIKRDLRRYNIFSAGGLELASLSDEATQYSSAYQRSPELFKFSGPYRTQRSALECLAAACRHVSLPRQVAADIVSTIWFYLSPTQQPPEFVRLVTQIYTEIQGNHGDVVWRVFADLGRVSTCAPAASLRHFDAANRNVILSFENRLAMDDKSSLFVIPSIEAQVSPLCRSLIHAVSGVYSRS